MASAAIANHTIKPALPKVKLKKQRYQTDDIIQLVNEVLKTDRDDTEQFARHFQPNKWSLKKLFDFVETHFEYIEDPRLNQWVQTPSYIWSSKKEIAKALRFSFPVCCTIWASIILSAM